MTGRRDADAMLRAARAGAETVDVRVRVQPRASREGIEGWRGDALAVRVTAPPVEGEANRAVAALIARALGVRSSAVAVVRGQRGRDKIVRVTGLTRQDVDARLGVPRGAKAGGSMQREVRQ